MRRRLLVLGLGYSGAAVAREALARGGWEVAATSRNPSRIVPPAGVALHRFEEAGPAIAEATHLLMTAAPGPEGDPAIAAHREALLRAAPRLRWAGYISTTGVYGDRGGAVVEETSEPSPGQERSRRRVAAEAQWASLAEGRFALDLFRTGGIYGPGRSALDDARAGTARRVVKLGHAFGRIHVEDIARAVLAAASQDRPPGLRVLHLVDDVPAEPAEVALEAARLLGLPAPREVPFAEAWAGMSEMARSFWAENRRVANARTKRELRIAWSYPSYREGLRAVLAEERRQG